VKIVEYPFDVRAMTIDEAIELLQPDGIVPTHRHRQIECEREAPINFRGDRRDIERFSLTPPPPRR